jgi:heme/copper-type cytochrome/quinol oxidase subunit 2
MRWTTVVVIVVIVVVVVLAALAFLLWKCRRRIKGKGTDHISDKLDF